MPIVYRLICSSLLLFALTLGLAPALAAQEVTVHTFFSRTQHPLKVHYIQGEKPGPTVMVQGGTQGDELSGILTAQLLTEAEVTRGNLIVVPRANVPAILAGQRRVNVDLNRRFDQGYDQYYEDILARAVRFLVRQSDALIHLHEGSGFYCPRWESSLRNPNRYGQSVIIDTAELKGSFNLARAVRQALPRLNADIASRRYHFQLFNTRTGSRETKYPEQRKSLTYFAVNECGVPAVAIEVSKDIKDKAWKLQQQLQASTIFLSRFGVEIELPGLSFSELKKRLDTMASLSCSLSLDGRKYPPGMPLDLGQSLDEAFSIDCNRGRKAFSRSYGLYAAAQRGLNLLQLSRAPLHGASERLTLRADGGKRLGSWPVQTGSLEETLAYPEKPLFMCQLNGEIRYVRAGQELVAHQGDRLILLGLWKGSQDEVLNMKGFVGHAGYNDGQDALQEILLDREFFIGRYLLETGAKDHWRCEVVRETEGRPENRMFVRVLPRKLEGLGLAAEAGASVRLPVISGIRYNLPPDRYTVQDLYGQVEDGSLLLFIDGLPLRQNESFRIEEGEEHRLDIFLASTFSPLTHVHLSGNTRQ